MNPNPVHAQVGDFIDREVVDPHGTKVGSVFDVYVDHDSDQPEWLAVSTGLFGTKVSFVPLSGARFDDDGNVMVAHEKSVVKDSPRVEPDGQLSEEEERDLYLHYGRTYEGPTSDGEHAEHQESATNKERDFSLPASGADPAMVRSEEELIVDKHLQESGRVRLRKWVETEQVHVTVPLERQMVRVIREPVQNGGVSVDGFGDAEEEIVLSEEVLDVSKRMVAKERFALETETVTEQVAVDETIRKERVDADGALSDDDADTNGAPR